ncbi:MAG TPA: PAS domain S-box protein [Terriglobales bacterium]|nr:PAS domain S-box protein [Terriglobales bacterium]
MVQSSPARSLPPGVPENPVPDAKGASPGARKLGSVTDFGQRSSSPLERARFRRALVLAVGLPFLLMALLATALLWAVRQLEEADRAAQHTEQIVTKSFQTLTLILDMETGVRGYVGTGNREFLQPYEQASPKVGPALDELGALVEAQDIEEAQWIAHIRSSLEGWQQFAADAIAKRAIGATGAAQINSTRGKFLMDHVRDQFSSLVTAEEDRRNNALISARRAATFTSRLGLLLSLAVAVLIALFAAYELFAISRTYETSLARADALSRELGKREAHFRVLAEAIPQMVWATAPDGGTEYFNRRWLDYVGGGNLSREPWLEHVHPDDQQKAQAAWRASLASGKAFAIELRLRDAAGDYRWHLGRALPLRNESGAIMRWLGTFTDIDDQKRAEEALIRLAAIVETSDDAIYSKDLDGFIHSWNRGAEKMYGYSADEMIGQNVSVLTPVDRRRESTDMLERLRRGQSIEHMETVRLRKDGTPIEVSLGISPIRTSAGQIVGASTIARNITERNRAAEALRKTEKLAATARLAGTMAHEINNPLEAVTHLLYLIDKSSSLDETARSYTRIAMGEVDRIGHIAKHALGFYREAAAPIDVNVAELISSVIELYTAGAQNKGVRMETQLETQACVKAFPGEMRQVFSNLIVNAVDAVQRGGLVKIRVKHGRDWKLDALGIRVLVSDNGPGIPESIRPHIFEPFFTTKGERGTGIGLWVSEGVLHKHGGRIRLKSSTGTMHGTTFSVFLPYVFSSSDGLC